MSSLCNEHRYPMCFSNKEGHSHVTTGPGVSRQCPHVGPVPLTSKGGELLAVAHCRPAGVHSSGPVACHSGARTHDLARRHVLAATLPAADGAGGTAVSPATAMPVRDATRAGGLLAVAVR